MKFSKDWIKLDNLTFTTIRKNTKFYTFGKKYLIKTPSKEFFVKLIGVRLLKKENITDQIAWIDASCRKEELIAMLEKWYGKKFDDFVLLTLKKEGL